MSRSWKTIGFAVLIAVHLPGWAVAQAPVAPPGNPGIFPGLAPVQTAVYEAKGTDGAFGKFGNGTLIPVNSLSGVLISPPCASDAVNPADLRQPANSLEGVAARIKKDEAEAGARRAKVRSLGTVDCLRYPEAEKALLTALRTDPNEGVRLEAALVLSRGCCWTQQTIAALTLTATGRDRDGNPPERSARVRQIASAALDFCRKHTALPTLQPDEKPGGGPRLLPPLEASPPDQVVRQEIQVSYQEAVSNCLTPPAPPPPSPWPVPGPEERPSNTGKRGLFDIIERAFCPMNSRPTEPAGVTDRSTPWNH